MHAVRNNATADGNSVTKARFFDNEELRYSLRSLFANGEGLGIGMVWIVTSQQVPAWFRPNSRVRIISCEVKTFNSNALLALLHHIIPDLAEHYIVWDDDVMLWRPVARDLYFHTDGSFSFFTEFYEDACNDAHSCAIWRSNQLLRNAYGRLAMRACCPSNAHVPHAMSRSMLLQLERRFESEVKATMAHPFRDRDDVNLFQLYPWFLLGERIAHPRRELAASVGVVVSMTRRTQRLGARLNLYLDHDRLESLLRHATFVCFNNGKEDAPELRELLQRRFPQPSPAEVGG